MISCLQSGLSTTNGAHPDGGCSVSELVAGSDPLGDSFKICYDSATNPNNVMSVEADACTVLPLLPRVVEMARRWKKSSKSLRMLEMLEVTRSAVNPRNGGYTWKVKFLFDEDGPCQQKDDMLGLCNSPGNVPNGE